MRYIVSLLVCLFLANCQTSRKWVAKPETSRYFEFHNNYWVNLHHYLYQEAKGSQLRKLEEDGNAFLSIGEEQALARMSADEKMHLQAAITYYERELADKHLRRELGELRFWLQQQEGFTIRDTAHSAALTAILNQVSPVYRAHLWPIHAEQNQTVLERHLSLIRSLEPTVIRRMEELAHYQWPDDGPVRVDLTAYANYAGAYTPTRPQFNLIISTLDPLCLTTSFMETVFHEGSHLLYRFDDSPFRGQIYHRCEELGQEFPSGLWHAAMFYLCGRVVQDELSARGIDHELEMDVRHIYESYNTPSFRSTLEQYYQGKVDMEQSVEQLLEQLRIGEDR